MLQTIQAAIKIRALVVFLLVHLGLVFGIFAMARVSFNGWDETAILVVAAISCLYGGFLLAVLFVALPLVPWLRRAQRVEHWTERLLQDLPKIIAVIQSLIALWNETKAQTSPEAPVRSHPARRAE